MANAELKTKKTKVSFGTFLTSIEDPEQRADSAIIAKMMGKATGQNPVLWGSSMVGFGHYHYKSPTSRREGDWFQIGFSPRSANLSLHFMDGVGAHKGRLKKMGKFTTGMGCLYIKKLADVNLRALEGMIKDSVKNMKARSK